MGESRSNGHDWRALAKRGAASTWLQLVVFVAMPTVVGGLLYVCFRPRHLLLFRWAETLHLAGAVTAVRLTLAPYGASLPDWLVGSAPAGLWAMALMAAIGVVWRGAPGRQRRLSLGAAAVFAMSSELLQWAGLLRGTFDPVDVLAYATGVAAGLLAGTGPTVNILITRKNHDL